MKTITLYIQGTHCASCKILIEDILQEHGFKSPKVDLKKETVQFEIDESVNGKVLVQKVNALLKENNYQVSLEKNAISHFKVNGETLLLAIPIGITILALFFFIQVSGILDIGIGGDVSPVTSFLIGLVASVSSCLAIVGGLVLSLSATVSQDNIPDKMPITLFHGGRIIGFTILGGILGLLGQSIGMSFTLSSILGILSALIMIILGLNLMGVLSKNLITLPTVIFRRVQSLEQTRFAPVVLGAGTFFLPCGFTQSMQVAALSSGSWVTGAIIMLFFSLGTLPVLATLSFGSISLGKGKYADVFFATSGVVVIGLGVFALLSGLAGLGVISPIFAI